jgi:hypothetical protein
VPRVFILQVHRKKIRLYFNALLAQNRPAFQAIALLQNRIARCTSALLISGKLIAQLKAVTLIVDFKYMKSCVSSPRVSKGCLESNPFGINVRLAKLQQKSGEASRLHRIKESIN